MPMADQLAARLRSIRRQQHASQEIVARATGLTISGISRLERGLRSMRVDLLVAWVGALGYRVDVVMWKPAVPSEQWDPDRPDDAVGLDDDCAAVLAEVASGVGFMPETPRKALVARMGAWKDAAASASSPPG